MCGDLRSQFPERFRQTERRASVLRSGGSVAAQPEARSALGRRNAIGAEENIRSERSDPKSGGKLAEQFGTHGDRSQIMEEEAQSIQIGAERCPTAEIR